MFRSPQALLISLSLHLVIGISILLFVVPKIRHAEPDGAARCRIVLSQVVPALPQAKPLPKPAAAQPVRKTVPQTSAHAPKKAVLVSRPKPVPVVEKPVEKAPEKAEPATQAEALPVPSASPVEMLEEPFELPAEPTAAGVSASPDPAPAAAAAEETPAVGSGASYLQQHLSTIAALLRDNLYYPRMARKRHIEGEVVARFTVETDGTVHGVSITRHARAILDRAAVQTIEGLSGRLPHPEQALTLDVPIRFVLK